MTKPTPLRPPVGARQATFLPALALGLLLAAPARAQVQANIERDLPVTFEDTIPQEYLGREFQLVNRYERTGEGEDRWLVEPRFEFGIWHNTQLTIAAPFLFGDADEGDGLGPVEVDLLYNINQETLDLPAFAVVAGAEFTGAAAAGGGDGIDPFVGFNVDYTLGRSSLNQKLHLNLMYQFNGSQLEDERDGRYEAVLGYSYAVEASTLLVADIARWQEMEENEEVNLVEFGIRQALTPQTVLSVGVGFGIGDESPDARLTLGFQYEF